MFLCTVYVLCLTEEDFGMLMLSVIANVHMCGQKGGKGMVEPGKGSKNGAVDSEHVTSKDRSSLSHTKSHHS
jgi:hypothetical protein